MNPLITPHIVYPPPCARYIVEFILRLNIDQIFIVKISNHYWQCELSMMKHNL